MRESEFYRCVYRNTEAARNVARDYTYNTAQVTIFFKMKYVVKPLPWGGRGVFGFVSQILPEFILQFKSGFVRMKTLNVVLRCLDNTKNTGVEFLHSPPNPPKNLFKGS